MKSIIMSTEDVRCIVNGVKTMKRIPISPQPEFSQIHLWNGTFVYNSINKKWCWKQHVSPDNRDEADCLLQFAPFKVGDILYVRETWGDYGECTGYYVYRADYPHDAKGYWYEKEHINWCDLPDWHSPVTMPREAARLFLRVTDVRVERVQDISVEDVMAEGLPCDNEIRNPDPETHESIKNWNLSYAQMLYHDPWDARNAKRGHGWDTNPFCWVIEFKRVEKGEES